MILFGGGVGSVFPRGGSRRRGCKTLFFGPTGLKTPHPYRVKPAGPASNARFVRSASDCKPGWPGQWPAVLRQADAALPVRPQAAGDRPENRFHPRPHFGFLPAGQLLLFGQRAAPHLFFADVAGVATAARTSLSRRPALMWFL